MRTFSIDVGSRSKVVEVDAGDGVDGIDGGEPVCSCAFCGACRDANVTDVWGELDENRRARFFFDPLRDHLRVIGNLTNGRAHAALAHSVRAAEVELEAVSSGVFGAGDNIVPGFAVGRP